MHSEPGMGLECRGLLTAMSRVVSYQCRTDRQREAVRNARSELQVSAVPPSGCIRQLAVLRPLCSLSPTIGTACGEDSAVGERAGVRRPERARWPPLPHPLPRNMHQVKATSLAGERGPETASWQMPPPSGLTWVARDAPRNLAYSSHLEFGISLIRISSNCPNSFAFGIRTNVTPTTVKVIYACHFRWPGDPRCVCQ